MKSQFSRKSAAWIVYIAVLCIAATTFSFAASGTWSPTGTMLSARDGHTATLLVNGQVLVAGGTNNGVALTSAELYNRRDRDLGFHRKHERGTHSGSRRTAFQWISAGHGWLR